MAVNCPARAFWHVVNEMNRHRGGRLIKVFALPQNPVCRHWTESILFLVRPLRRT